MRNETPPDAIDTRIVYRIYGGLMLAAGFVLAAWGPSWFGTDFAGQPFVKAALVRIAGSIMVGAGCVGMAVAGMDDPEGRRRGFLWFAVAHAVVLAVVFAQVRAVWGLDASDITTGVVLGGLATTMLLFFHLFTAANGMPFFKYGSALTSLFGGGHRAAAALRSRHEEQIRAAASQEERHRLARDLHDSIKQQIFAIHTSAATAEVRFNDDPPGARAAIDQVRRSAREAMTEMEAMLDQLRAAPLDADGLVEAIRKQAEAVGFRTGARVDVEVGRPPAAQALQPGATQAAFRVVQEALSNAARHARASHVRVAVGSTGDGGLSLEVEDNGAGFDVKGARPGLGLANMRQRAADFGGTLNVASTPGHGTAIALVLPATVPAGEDYAAYRKRAAIYGMLLPSGGVFLAIMARQDATSLWFGVPIFVHWTTMFLQQLVGLRRLRRRMEAAR